MLPQRPPYILAHYLKESKIYNFRPHIYPNQGVSYNGILDPMMAKVLCIKISFTCNGNDLLEVALAQVGEDWSFEEIFEA